MRRQRRGSSSGTAGLEFAIIAPVLILAVLSTADIGLAIHESFEVDQALRNGAEVALSDPGESRVAAILSAVDDTRGEQLSTTWEVNRYYACSETPNTKLEVDSRNCSGKRPTAIFYEIKGVRAYRGFLLPARNLTRLASVQVR
ncbi:TadE/TadG family type IV pilus assembly protein [Loktanella sp. DJP18]|uniref:TadE/TadG family type IV pilus assembly protein n=1 Tax=Loktanella sp. DJP18 TaxID=3409788 RepID=UPI003BB76444